MRPGGGITARIRRVEPRLLRSGTDLVNLTVDDLCSSVTGLQPGTEGRNLIDKPAPNRADEPGCPTH
jgi:hypothetical protein